MDRTYYLGLLKRCAILALAAFGGLLIHATARMLWAFAGYGQNLTMVPVTTREFAPKFDVTKSEYISLGYTNRIIATEGPRTFWNYDTGLGDIIGSHIWGLLIVAVAVAVTFLLVQLVTWLFTGHGVFGFPKHEYVGADCTNRFCPCDFHSDETFDEERNEWRDATKEEMAARVPVSTR